MRLARAAAVAAVAVIGGCTGGNGYVRWEDLGPEQARASPAADDAPATGAGATTSTATTPTTAPPPPERPRAIAAAPVSTVNDIVIDGKSVADGGVVDMPALELACMAAPDALTEPAKVRARFDAAAEKLGVTSASAFSFVVLERDPARSVTDPPPHWCLELKDAKGTMKAPLLREREASSKWIVKKISKSLADDAAGLLSANDKRAAVAHPRVIVDDSGALVAVALPVGD